MKRTTLLSACFASALSLLAVGCGSGTAPTPASDDAGSGPTSTLSLDDRSPTNDGPSVTSPPTTNPTTPDTAAPTPTTASVATSSSTVAPASPPDLGLDDIDDLLAELEGDLDGVASQLDELDRDDGDAEWSGQ